MSVEQQLRVLKLEDVKRLRTELLGDAAKISLMLKEIDSDIGKEMLNRQKKHLKDLQESYFNIDVTDYPNVVVAKLAGMIGQELEVRDNIKLYENPIKRKKELDEQIAMCDDVISNKEKEVTIQRR